MNKQVIGDLQFWRETIVFYRVAANQEKNLKRRIRLAKCLNDARGFAKYAESKYLVVIVLAAILFFSQGCQAASGLGRDITNISESLRN